MLTVPKQGEENGQKTTFKRMLHGISCLCARINRNLGSYLTRRSSTRRTIRIVHWTLGSNINGPRKLLQANGVEYEWN